MIPFDVEMVSILSEYLRQTVIVQMLTFSQVNGHHKQVLLKQHLNKVVYITFYSG